MNFKVMYSKETNASETVVQSIFFQIDSAINQSVDSVIPSDELVFELRKNTKRIKALFQLLKPILEQSEYYQLEENISQAGRILSEQRDASVQLDTLHHLINSHKHHFSAVVIKHLQNTLQSSMMEVFSNNNEAFSNRTLQYAILLQKVKQQLGSCVIEPVDNSYFFAMIKKSYHNAMNYFDHVKYRSETEIVHSWRKSLKKLLLQLKFSPIVPSRYSDESAKSLDRLTEILGNEHDLAVLENHISSDSELSTDEINRFLRIISSERNKLTYEAINHGNQFFSTPWFTHIPETASV
jgi:CHAD domain-containing protein